MPSSELKLIKRFAEYQSRDEIESVPRYTRGIYVLHRYRPKLAKYDVAYIGMAGGKKAGIRGRLRRHSRSKAKSDLWTHFSIFEVHDNINEQEVEELEGLFRHMYRKDTRANKLNRQRSYHKLRQIKANKLRTWM